MTGNGAVRILVPTDFSPAADAALASAMAWAQPLSAEVMLLHVREPAPQPELEGRTLDTSDAMAAWVTAGLDERARRVRGAGLACSVHCVRGSPAREIVAAARRDQAQLVVMGTRGPAGDVGACALGVVANEVARKLSCAVLLVPPPEVRDAVYPRGARTHIH